MERIKVLIIGSGPAGYTAAIYGGRANLSPVLYSGIQPGGQLTTTTIIENFPGFHEGIDANILMQEMKQQAEHFGADVRDGSIVKADLSSRPFKLEDESGNQIEAESLIIATGASAKYLGLADEEKYRGEGVSACATCDGFFYRKRVVAVVGGGDTACEEATYLAGLARKVYMIVRKPYLRAAEIMRKRVEENPNIEILYNLVFLAITDWKAPISCVSKASQTKKNSTSQSTDSSSPSVTSQTPTFSKAKSTSMNKVLSSPNRSRPQQTSKESLQPAMWPTRPIVKESSPPRQVQWQLSKPTVSCDKPSRLLLLSDIS